MDKKMKEKGYTRQERMKAGFEVLFGTKHERLPEAVIADILDTVPFIGDIGNAVRTVKEENERRRAMQMFDTLAGSIPDPFGGIIDVLTPTNTFIFVNKKLKEYKKEE